jgi:hypothetical protein
MILLRACIRSGRADIHASNDAICGSCCACREAPSLHTQPKTEASAAQPLTVTDSAQIWLRKHHRQQLPRCAMYMALITALINGSIRIVMGHIKWGLAR